MTEKNGHASRGQLLARRKARAGDDVLLHFGVVGEGRGMKVLGLGCMSSLVKDDDECHWTCTQCEYENADIMNRTCSMCGTRRTAVPSIVSISSRHSNQSTRSMDSIDEDGKDAPVTITRKPSRRLPRQLSKRETSMRQLFAKKLSGSVCSNEDDEIPLESLTREKHEIGPTDMSKSFASFANVSVAEGGGWTCPDCTFVNTNILHLTCSVCGQQKPSQENSLYVGSSLRNFLAHSNESENLQPDVDPQLEAYLMFEQIIAEKDMMVDLVKEQRAILRRAAGASQFNDTDMIELRGVLEEGEETLKSLKKFYDDEKKEYDAMVELQLVKSQEIEEREGISPMGVVTSKASRPGAQRISGEVLEWHGQQRMLDDWKFQLDGREMQIKQLQAQQKEALTRLLG